MTGNSVDAQNPGYLERQIDNSACGTSQQRPVINLSTLVMLEISTLYPF